MRLLAQIGARELALEVARTGGRAALTVDGRRVPIEARRLGASVLLTRARKKVEAIVVRVGGRGERAYAVLIRGRSYRVALVDPLREAARAGSGPATAGRAQIRSVMPGKVRAILVQPGDQVRAGQGLIVIEAMKMENEIPAPKAGRVVAIGVKAGDAVEAGAPLCSVE